MKFVRFAAGARKQVGVVQGDSYRVIEGHDDLLGLIRQGDETLRQAGEQAARTGALVDPATVRNLSPIATPPTFRDFYAFEQHVKAGRESRGLEMNPLWYKIPAFYFSNPYNFRGEGEIPMTPGSERFDFELEVAAVLGRGGQDFTAEEGEDIFGSGTCGTGCILELSRTHGEGEFSWLQAGDEALIEIEGLGTQRTTIAKTPEPASFRRQGLG